MYFEVECIDYAPLRCWGCFPTLDWDKVCLGTPARSMRMYVQYDTPLLDAVREYRGPMANTTEEEKSRASHLVSVSGVLAVHMCRQQGERGSCFLGV